MAITRDLGTPFSAHSAPICLAISMALPVCDPYRMSSSFASSAWPLAAAPLAAPLASLGRRAALRAGRRWASFHGSTASSSPTASFASQRTHICCPPRNLSAPSSACPDWLQSLAVVVWRSRRRLVSPTAQTANCSLSVRRPRTPSLRLRMKKRTHAPAASAGCAFSTVSTTNTATLAGSLSSFTSLNLSMLRSWGAGNPAATAASASSFATVVAASPP
mmetsp:Transcript_29967/g.65519  ORF Transcript_29967/g.65519 Transcript_29967/m.65519 type:complete len:219 (-) Transcript_29967:14-670(-)